MARTPPSASSMGLKPGETYTFFRPPPLRRWGDGPPIVHRTREGASKPEAFYSFGGARRFRGPSRRRAEGSSPAHSVRSENGAGRRPAPPCSRKLERAPDSAVRNAPRRPSPALRSGSSPRSGRHLTHQNRIMALVVCDDADIARVAFNRPKRVCAMRESGIFTRTSSKIVAGC